MPVQKNNLAIKDALEKAGKVKQKDELEQDLQYEFT